MVLSMRFVGGETEGGSVLYLLVSGTGVMETYG